MKILIVEDDFTLAGEICRLCEKWDLRPYLEEFQEVDSSEKKAAVTWCSWILTFRIMTDFTGAAKFAAFPEFPFCFCPAGIRMQTRSYYGFRGDDYVEKPFDTELLLVKIRALLRRAYEYTQADREYLGEHLVYDRNQGVLLYKGRTIEMTKSENRILGILAENKGRVVEREELMQHLWSTDEYVTDASLTVLVSRLRAKIAECADGVSCIHTRKGKGYYLE